MNPCSLRVLCAALFLPLMPVAWTAAQAQSPDSGWNMVSAAAGQCLDVAENRRGGQVVLSQCGNYIDRPFQIWTLRGNQYLNVASGLCLDAVDVRAGGPVVLEACEAPSQRPFQYWTAREFGREFNEASGLCLDAAQTNFGWQAVVDNCGDDLARPGQRWLALTIIGPNAPLAAPQGTADASQPALPPGSAEGFVWDYQRYVSENLFETRLSVTYGIPQTDAYQASLSCQIGNRGPYALMLLGTSVSGLATGQAVRMTVSGDGGYVEDIDVTVVRAEEGLEGVEFAVALDGRFFAALRDLTSIRYLLPGQTPAILPLIGSSVPVLEFLSDCSNIDGLSTPGTIVTGGDDYGCSGLDMLRSGNSTVPQFARFENQSEGYRVINWVDFEGQQIQYGALNPGEVMEISTYLTHPWVITDGPGNCLQVIEISAGVESYPIVAPNRNFGSE